MNTFVVRVTKDHLVFSAGHFITYNGDICERLHGHNWRVAVEVEGPLDENHYVFDFIALLELARAVAAELDHRMLLPDGSGRIRIVDAGPNYRVEHGHRFWSFPRDECVVLPIPNTTTERIAEWFNARLRQAISERGLTLPEVIRVEVEENFGQSATHTWRRPDPSAP
ncbi:MAG: 6-pyruvoyl tetrahydrobiopterin synthase [Isosphaeraceae bacterium]|jgi:6-pyruvoyltetrahydropterin/6-carboxytetrahydropterin synthase|nr:MAG: 6-pyruvoyl tetrahydrobiopterin synthase [Isosphaeraceae bacterium]